MLRSCNKWPLILYETRRDFAYLLQRVKMRETETRIEVSGGGFEQNSVTIMTIHKSKGLEFPVVFLAGVTCKR